MARGRAAVEAAKKLLARLRRRKKKEHVPYQKVSDRERYLAQKDEIDFDPRSEGEFDPGDFEEEY